jgi:hypothetical protein
MLTSRAVTGASLSKSTVVSMPKSAADRQRDTDLAALGYRVIRIWNNDVIGNIAGVLARISHTGSGFDGQPRQLHAETVAMKICNLREFRRAQWCCCDWRVEYNRRLSLFRQRAAALISCAWARAKSR